MRTTSSPQYRAGDDGRRNRSCGVGSYRCRQSAQRCRDYRRRAVAFGRGKSRPSLAARRNHAPCRRPCCDQGQYLGRWLASDAGSRLFADFVAPGDAIAVERLKKAGAIVVGMGATSEFACKGVTTSLLFGPTRHPLDPELTPGGRRWPGNGCRSRPRTAGDRYRRRRLEPTPSGPRRCCRLQTILWSYSIWPRVRRAVFRHIRDRTDRSQRRRRSARIRSDGRPRCPRF